MARYKDIELLDFMNLSNKSDEFCEGVRFAMEEADKLPTANIVEVVRCKDCKFYDKEFTNFAGKHKCKRFDRIVLDDNKDFCSYGERK